MSPRGAESGTLTPAQRQARRRLPLYLRRRYPIWDLRTISIVAMLVIGVSAALVFLIGHKSVLQELQITLLLVSATLFVFLSVGLYRGVRVRKQDAQVTRPDGVSFSDVAERFDGTGMPDIDCPMDVADGLLGIVLSLLLWIVVAVAAVFLVWLLLNLAVGVVVVLPLTVYWVLSRALRQVFARSRTCRGRLWPSLAYAAMYTFLYTGWLLAVILGARLLVQHVQ